MSKSIFEPAYVGMSNILHNLTLSQLVIEIIRVLLIYLHYLDNHHFSIIVISSFESRSVRALSQLL